jgi:L-asparaginase
MLRDLAKSVVLTGSQIPIGRDVSDAQTNLTTALWAIEADIWGVSVAFNRRIIRGTRAVKISTMSFDAFQSVNAPYLAQITAEGMHVVDDGHQYACAGKPFTIAPELYSKVFLLKVIPGTQPDLIESLPALGYKSLVIEAFGAGGIHYLHRNLLQSLNGLIGRGMLVVICSQCLYDRSDLTLYEVGRQLLNIGVVPALDMTTEAIVTKLMWIWGQTDDYREAKELFCRNLAGEMS